MFNWQQVAKDAIVWIGRLIELWTDVTYSHTAIGLFTRPAHLSLPRHATSVTRK